MRYPQLAHNEWDPAAQRSRTKVLYSFGRTDDLDRAGIQRLVDALSRLLDPGAATGTGAGGLEMTEARVRSVAPMSRTRCGTGWASTLRCGPG